MKKFAVAMILTLATTAAYADSCKATATDKKLAGAAKPLAPRRPSS